MEPRIRFERAARHALVRRSVGRPLLVREMVAVVLLRGLAAELRVMASQRARPRFRRARVGSEERRTLGARGERCARV